MFGRVRRSTASTERLIAAAVLHVYRPEALADALAVGMGTAAVASGAALVRTADGQLVSAVAEATDRAIGWGRKAQQRYLRLPGRVLAQVTTETVELHEWTLVGGRGTELARWPVGSFQAQRVRYIGQVGVRIVAGSGKAAILTGRPGPLHPATRAVIEAILRSARQPSVEP
jgi:hypothetical protein